MIPQIKCPRDLDGKGCLFWQKKGVHCTYSVKQKPGPKCRKRIQYLGPATEVTEAPNDSFTPPRQQQHSLAKGVAGSKGGFDAGDGDGFGGRVGGKSVSPLMETCPPSIPLLRPPKKPKTTYDGGYRSARQKRPFEAEVRPSDPVATKLRG